MNFSKQSEFILKKLNMNPSIPMSKNKEVIKLLYDLIHKANAEVKNININARYFSIRGVSDIPKPNSFNSKYLPEIIKRSINDDSTSYITYLYVLGKRQITINIVFSEENIELRLSKYTEYIRMMLLWLSVVTNFSSKSCSNRLTVYLYMTNYKKTLPASTVDTIGINNINSGYSDVCRRDSEIVIYRKEEWLKVFIHETFHNFGLEFSGMNIDGFKIKIKNIFPIESEFALYECWAESWALIMNTGLCAYNMLDELKKRQDFILYYEFLILNEKMFTCLQVVKILNHMNLRYEVLIDPRMKEQVSKLYKEDTNIFAYFIVKLLLIFNDTKFINWCKTNNPHMIKFMNTEKNIVSLFHFIKNMYKNKQLISTVREAERFYRSTKSNKMKNTLRMSLCELV